MKTSSWLAWTTENMKFFVTPCKNGLLKWIGSCTTCTAQNKTGIFERDRRWSMFSLLQHSCSLVFSQALCYFSLLLVFFWRIQRKNEREHKNNFFFFFLYCLQISFFTETPGTAQTTHNKGWECCAVMKNCQGELNQWPQHEQICYCEMGLAAKLPEFHVFLVLFQM